MEQLGRKKVKPVNSESTMTSPNGIRAKAYQQASYQQLPPAAMSDHFRLAGINSWLPPAACGAGAAALCVIASNPVLDLNTKFLAFCVVALLAIFLVVARKTQWEFEGLESRLRKVTELAQVNSSVIASFAMAIDAKDQHTHGHTERVRDMAVKIGKEFELSPEQLKALETAAMLHDIGKLAVPDYILCKPQQLTAEEMKKVQTHTVVGAAMLESVNFPWPVVPIIRSHHEWYNGKGYPDGVAGNYIDLCARILSVADVYDALCSHRPFRSAMTVENAIAFMRERAGTQFDPEVLTACFRVCAEEQDRNRFGFIFDGNSTTKSLASRGGDAFMGVRQAPQELLALYEIVQTMGQSLNMQETLDLVISKTKQIIDFTTCVLLVIYPEEGQLVAVAATGPHAEAIQGKRMPMGSGVSGESAASGKPIGRGRAAKDDLSILLGPAAANCPLTEVLAAPLTDETEIIGTLTFYRLAGRSFTEDDARLAVMVARQAGMAINNALQYEQTKQSAMTDQLTGLANSRYFYMHLQQELSRARREQTPVSLIAIDMDNLKQINDNYGHQHGDRVLQMLAEIFRRHVRDYDTVVRYAGDEFFIILPQTTNKRALETANRIKQAVRETKLEMLPGRSVNFSASFGVATFPGDAVEPDALIAVADRAMYADKRLSRQAALLVEEERREDERETVQRTQVSGS